MKDILNFMKMAYGKELKRIQRNLRIKIRKAKEKYRRKLECKLQQNNMSRTWSVSLTFRGMARGPLIVRQQPQDTVRYECL